MDVAIIRSFITLFLAIYDFHVLFFHSLQQPFRWCRDVVQGEISKKMRRPRGTCHQFLFGSSTVRSDEEGGEEQEILWMAWVRPSWNSSGDSTQPPLKNIIYFRLFTQVKRNGSLLHTVPRVPENGGWALWGRRRVGRQWNSPFCQVQPRRVSLLEET